MRENRCNWASDLICTFVATHEKWFCSVNTIFFSFFPMLYGGRQDVRIERGSKRVSE